MKKKSLVIVAGTKGGTGKSLTATLIYAWLKEKNIRVTAFDGDNENSTLCRFVPEAGFVDMRQPHAMDQVLEPAINDTVDVVLLDSRAGTSDEILDWLRSIGVEEIQRELDCAITIVAIVTSTMDTVEQLKRWTDELTDKVRWLVVRNTVYGEPTIYDESNLRKRVREELKGRELFLPKFLEVLMQDLDKASLSIHAGSVSSTLSFVHRSRCKTILPTITERLNSIEEVILP
jgi:CO dehydrogenase nickel-insertion accessory protein CooC1